MHLDAVKRWTSQQAVAGRASCNDSIVDRSAWRRSAPPSSWRRRSRAPRHRRASSPPRERRPGPTSSGSRTRTWARGWAPTATAWRARPCSTGWRRRRSATPMRSRWRRSARPAARPSSPACTRRRSARSTCARPRPVPAARSVSRRAALLRQGVPRVPARRRLLSRTTAKTDYNFGVPFTIWDDLEPEGALARPRAGAALLRRLQPDGDPREPQLSEQPVAQGQAARHDPAAIPVPPYYPDTPVVREELARLYDNLAAMDPQVAAILAELEEDGLAENTVVFYWSDHGAACRAPSGGSTTPGCACR